MVVVLRVLCQLRPIPDARSISPGMTFEYRRPLVSTSRANRGHSHDEPLPKHVRAAERRRSAGFGRLLAKEEELRRVERRLGHLVMKKDLHRRRRFVGREDARRPIQPHGVRQRIFVRERGQPEGRDKAVEILGGAQAEIRETKRRHGDTPRPTTARPVRRPKHRPTPGRPPHRGTRKPAETRRRHGSVGRQRRRARRSVSWQPMTFA